MNSEWVKYVNMMIVADHHSHAKARTAFAHSSTEIICLNPIGGMDVSVHLFCVCVVLHVGSGLATG
jgi:hypothetical protein